MWHISPSVPRRSYYHSVYPSLTSIYTFNPSSPEDTSPTIPVLLSLPCFLTLSLLHLPPHPSYIFFFLQFPAISSHSFSPLVELSTTISLTLLYPHFWFRSYLHRLVSPPPLRCYSLFFFFLSTSEASGPRAKWDLEAEVLRLLQIGVSYCRLHAGINHLCIQAPLTELYPQMREGRFTSCHTFYLCRLSLLPHFSSSALCNCLYQLNE